MIAACHFNSPETVNALVESLRFDPFYIAISEAFADSEARRRAALADYFDYSMTEGARMGHLVVWPDPAVAAAVWLLPAKSPACDSESTAKAAFLVEVMGVPGAENYRRIVEFMKPRSRAVIDQSAWYLSIIGVAPAAQGRGIGARLLQPTLAQADEAQVGCYLETFDSRNPRFYERLGFYSVASHVEPVTRSAYTIMSRSPKVRAQV